MSYIGDLKAALDPLFEGRVFRDNAPPKTAFPYATIYDDVSRTPLTAGDGHTTARRRRIQVSVWQYADRENPELVTDAESACEHADTSTHTKVTFSRRLPADPGFPNVSHRVMWVEFAERTPVT